MTEPPLVAWLCAVRNVCQGALGRTLDGDPGQTYTVAEGLQRALPVPSNAFEMTLLRQYLAMFTYRTATEMHHRYHAIYEERRCTGTPPLASEHVWMDSSRPVSVLLNEWARGYSQWFEGTHTVAPALRARQILGRELETPPGLEKLAVAVGCCRTRLIGQFRNALGVSPGEYSALVRMRAALGRLREQQSPIDQIARDVGYQSENKFYARLRAYTGLAPSAIRGLSEPAFETLLERLQVPHGQQRTRASSRGAGRRASDRQDQPA